MSGANIYTAWETQFWKTPPAALLIPGSFFLRVFFEISHIMPENEYNWCLGLKYCWGWEGLSRSLSKYTLDFWFTFWYVKCVCRFALRKPLFEIWWFYMGIAQIALDPPPSVKHGKKVPQTILASPCIPRQRGKKVPQKILQSFTPPPSGNAHMEATHFKKGLPRSTSGEPALKTVGYSASNEACGRPVASNFFIVASC